MRIKLIVLLISFLLGDAYCQDTLVFNNSKKNFHVGGEKLLVFEDNLNQICTPNDLLGKEFKKLPSHFFMNENPASTYWLKLMVIDSSNFDQHWFFISYNGNVDSFQLYVMDKDTQLFTNEYHYKSTKMSERDLEHKNFTMEFSIPKNKPVEVYIKLKNPKSFQYG
ncbi:MAG: hypothetical protein K2Q22_00320, partial [Cytophagales bacterium]|nr:hypothetical protein [Cytophagales bacterium]